MSAQDLEAVTPDPMALVRAINRMKASGFSIRADQARRLLVSPLSKLTEPQRAFVRAHKAALVTLLQDAERLAALLDSAGSAGLGWKQGTPPEWDDGRLLAVDEVLYSTGRMVSRLGRRYARTVAPSIPAYREIPSVAEIAATAEEIA